MARKPNFHTSESAPLFFGDSGDLSEHFGGGKVNLIIIIIIFRAYIPPIPDRTSQNIDDAPPNHQSGISSTNYI